MSEPAHLFVSCQRGAERALKAEAATRFPDWRASFSRPGFVTFKAPAGLPVDPAWTPELILARTWSRSLGRVECPPPAEPYAIEQHPLLNESITKLRELSAAPWHQLHVWSRDAAPVGERGYEPGQTVDDLALQSALRARLGELLTNAADNTPRVGQRVLDVVRVEADQWWIGEHTIRGGEPWTRWPGGVFTTAVGEEIVSRAYLKMREALACFRWPAKRGETALEIGSSPGGASQALLAAGLHVIGVDPAEMHPTLLADKHFTHLRMRGHELRKARLRGVKWLTADINVAPQYTLDTVEQIVTNAAVRVAGMLLTIKLADWELFTAAPEHLARVRSWGYRTVRARQLSHNRREYCLYALRDAK